MNDFIARMSFYTLCKKAQQKCTDCRFTKTVAFWKTFNVRLKHFVR